MPEDLLDNSDIEVDGCSSSLNTSEKKEVKQCTSGKKREAQSNLKFSESKLKKPRTLLPPPTSIGSLRSPLATVNRSINLMSNSKLPLSITKKVILEDESVSKSKSKIPSLLVMKENLRMPSSVCSSKGKVNENLFSQCLCRCELKCNYIVLFSLLDF